LNATVNASGGTTTALTIKYSTVKADVDAGNGTSATVSPTSATGNINTPVSAAITGLTAGTVYYFRVSATNAAGTANGSTLSFTTAALAPVISYAGASSPVTLSTGTAMAPLTVGNSGGAIEPLQVTTLAGSSYGYADGTGTSARFGGPYGVAVDASGTVYVADNGNHRIRKITISGSTATVSTLAGSTQGFADGTGTGARFNLPNSVAVDASGNMYVADANNQRIRKITPAGEVTTLSGSGTPGDANGTGTGAQFKSPSGVAVDASGNLYVSDYGNSRIRKVSSAGEVTTLAGSTAGYADGEGTAATFRGPVGVTVDGSGILYVADYNNQRIRKVTSSGVVTTLAGSALGSADGTGTSAQFMMPNGVALDGSGNLYVADQ
jgi:sugar lactone lactonase YvrE